MARVSLARTSLARTSLARTPLARALLARVSLGRAIRTPAGLAPAALTPVALALALLCAGCALAFGTPPEVEVASVELRGAGLLDQVLGVTLCVTNPNPSELAFRRIRVALDAAGSPLAEGVTEAPVQVPPRSSVLVPFTVVSTLANIGPQLLAVVRSGALDYRLRGAVTLDSPGLTVPFSRSGRLGLLQAGRALTDSAAPAGMRCTAAG